MQSIMIRRYGRNPKHSTQKGKPFVRWFVHELTGRLDDLYTKLACERVDFWARRPFGEMTCRWHWPITGRSVSPTSTEQVPYRLPLFAQAQTYSQTVIQFANSNNNNNALFLSGSQKRRKQSVTPMHFYLLGLVLITVLECDLLCWK